jgi:hypothetical protein
MEMVSLGKKIARVCVRKIQDCIKSDAGPGSL